MIDPVSVLRMVELDLVSKPLSTEQRVAFNELLLDLDDAGGCIADAIALLGDACLEDGPIDPEAFARVMQSMRFRVAKARREKRDREWRSRCLAGSLP